MKIERRGGFLGGSGLRGGRDTLISLAELTGALQGRQLLHTEAILSETHFPRRCFMSREDTNASLNYDREQRPFIDLLLYEGTTTLPRQVRLSTAGSQNGWPRVV